ncbi:MAG TPA: hypothetical protein VKU02_09535 [Gemmataceae bacterium]|nr:hypothetical protein [Gemmataceae bacterium]
MRYRPGSLVLLIAILTFGTLLTGHCFLLPAKAPAAPEDKPKTQAEGLKKRAIGLVVSPLPDWFMFQSKDTVNGWINSEDNKAIVNHAWELWGALTSLTNQELNGQKVPIYETWWDADEVLLAPGLRKAALPGIRRFHRPVQFRHAAKARSATVPEPSRLPNTLFDIVKYNDDIKKHVDQFKYYDHTVLDGINDNWPQGTPIADRKLQDFPDTSVMLKPVYRRVSGTAVTILPYWAGPVNSTTPSTPGPTTWTKKMAVVPPDCGLALGAVKIREGGEDLPAVPVNQFYNIKLTKEEAAALNPPAKEGDYMILVGMHVSSREIDNWTWQTFWWSFEKPAIPPAVKYRVQAPFDHYQVAVGYTFMTGRGGDNQDNPDSLPTVCFNPYLEANFGNDVFIRPGQLGIESNCMSCHRCAAWPATSATQQNPNYIANGLVDPGDPTVFAGKTKTDFSWGVADGRP